MIKRPQVLHPQIKGIRCVKVKDKIHTGNRCHSQTRALIPPSQNIIAGTSKREGTKLR